MPSIDVFPTGVESSGEVGDVFVLAAHVPNQIPNYTEISPTDESGWSDIDPTQDPNFTEITP